jgi:hypothetical protein
MRAGKIFFLCKFSTIPLTTFARFARSLRSWNDNCTKYCIAFQAASVRLPVSNHGAVDLENILNKKEKEKKTQNKTTKNQKSTLGMQPNEKWFDGNPIEPFFNGACL